MDGQYFGTAPGIVTIAGTWGPNIVFNLNSWTDTKILGYVNVPIADNYGAGTVAIVTQGYYRQNEPFVPVPQQQFGITAWPATNTGLPPTISQSYPLWFFGAGQNTPAAFTLGKNYTVLTANASGGTYKWTVTNGATKASFGFNTIQSSITTTTNAVVLWSYSYSTSPNDVTVSLQWTDGADSN